MLTPRAYEVLEQMGDADKRGAYEESELICEGNLCYLDISRISRHTVLVLLQYMAISTISEPGSLERYEINETGRAILEAPWLATKLARRLRTGRPFQIVDYRIVDI